MSASERMVKMAEINGRKLLDKNGEVYYPITNILFVEGMPENIADLDTEEISNLGNKVATLENMINSLVNDTGWQEITPLNGTTAFSTAETPKARLVTVNGVSFLSLKGAFKGLTSVSMELGLLPANIGKAVVETRAYAQTMSVSGGIAHFTRMRVVAGGTIKIERTTLETITENHWFPIETTIML